MYDIIQKPKWHLILWLVPIVNIYFVCSYIHNISKAYGKGIGFTLGNIFLGFIFLPLLTFLGEYQYGDGSKKVEQSDEVAEAA